MTRWIESAFGIAFVIVVALLALSIRPTPTPGPEATTAVAGTPDGASLPPTPTWAPTASRSETPVANGTDAPAPTSAARSGLGSPYLAGYATWYDNGPGFYLAAGPDLRRVLGLTWRDRSVVVCGFHDGYSVCRSAPVTDACACGQRNGYPTLVDLSRDLFAAICWPLTRGVCKVELQS